jgi:predicted Ser/Thr protein kinase
VDDVQVLDRRTGAGISPAAATLSSGFKQSHKRVLLPVCLLDWALHPAAEGKDEPSEHEASLPDQGRFDHYELVCRMDGTFEELGRGAMGVTYRARDTVLGHAVALKVLDARIAAHPDARERFLREARAAARLRHPNVASVFYYGVRTSDGQCFYAMELVEGETLRARLHRQGPLPVPVALEVVAQVARALGAAEARGLVHRDLKPSNLMLVGGPGFTVKVIDFGLAKAVAGTEESTLTCGGFVGTSGGGTLNASLARSGRSCCGRLASGAMKRNCDAPATSSVATVWHSHF